MCTTENKEKIATVLYDASAGDSKVLNSNIKLAVKHFT